MQNNNRLNRLEAIKKEQKKLTRYLIKSQKAINKNVRKLKELQREEEILLNPSLPGLFKD